jgi:hypothetical protein
MLPLPLTVKRMPFSTRSTPPSAPVAFVGSTRLVGTLRTTPVEHRADDPDANQKVRTIPSHPYITPLAAS